jgi:hypothetical protein
MDTSDCQSVALDRTPTQQNGLGFTQTFDDLRLPRDPFWLCYVQPQQSAALTLRTWLLNDPEMPAEWTVEWHS